MKIRIKNIAKLIIKGRIAPTTVLNSIPIHKDSAVFEKESTNIRITALKAAFLSKPFFVISVRLMK